MTRRSRRTFARGAALAVAVAACGPSGAPDDAASSTTTIGTASASPETSTTPTPDSPATSPATSSPPGTSLPSTSTPATPEPATSGAVATTTTAMPAPGDSRPAHSGGAPRCTSFPPVDGDGVAFTDITAEMGLVEPLTGMFGHAVAAADVNGDGWTDLFVGGFADRPVEHYQERGATGPSPDRLLLGGPDGFAVDPRFPGELARTSGATFADLTGDGRSELIAVRNPRGDDEISSRPTTIYRQVDNSWEAATTLLPDTAGRAAAAVDVDRDGLLDLVVTADRWGGGSTRLLRNLGDLTFEDATDEWGMPDDMVGLAVATVDLDGDGWTDIVVSGDTRVLIGGPGGFSVENHDVLAWELHGAEDDPAGIAVGDLTGDGRPDLVIGQHFNSTLDGGERVPVRIFVNRSDGAGLQLEDVTGEAGSPGLWTKSPHVAVVDLDDDGRPDVVTSAIAADGTPLVLRNAGVDADGTPRFETVGEQGDGSYLVTGVEVDLTGDGRVDLFQIEWFPEQPSTLFANRGAGGHRVQIDLTGTLTGGTARVDVTSTEGGDHLGTAWVTSSSGYAAGAPPVAHIGLGDRAANVDRVTVTVTGHDGTVTSYEAPIDARSPVGGC